MLEAIAPLCELLKLNTRLFLNCLDGVDDAMARERPSDGTNSIGFLACHVLHARYYLGSHVGLEAVNPFQELFDSAHDVNDLEVPPLDELRSAWSELSALLVDRLPEVTEAELGRASGQEFPVDDGTVRGAVAFLVQHESFHIGQLALLRKYFGLEGMAYAGEA
ncbi:MAG: DinB family protein [Gemmatimonadota bacterium]|nr:MAG: DinB family protein [Gemmatimonadota bacterium]